jgi:hypothetical protein
MTTKTKIYLCGGSTEAGMVAAYVNDAGEAGYEVTLDWASARIREIAKAGGQVTDALHSVEERRAIADAERAAVRASDIIWLLMPAKASFGAGYEFGLSEGRVATRMVSGPWENSNFTEGEGILKFRTHDDAMEWLTLQMMSKRASED